MFTGNYTTKHQAKARYSSLIANAFVIFRLSSDFNYVCSLRQEAFESILWCFCLATGGSLFSGLFKRKVEFSCEISPRFLFLKL